MAAQSGFRSPLSLVALGALAVAVIVLNSQAWKRARSPEPNPPECEGLTAEECRALSTSLQVAGTELEGAADRAAREDAPVEGREFLSAEAACRDVGYLCAEVEATGSLQILRWPRETQLIRIWVPEPTGIPAGLAREFQRAAVRGIQSWHGHPIPLLVRGRTTGEEPHVTIQWVQSVEDGRLGRAEMEWRSVGGKVDVQIVGFFIATHLPGNPAQALDPRQVELIAAHEMGHALGLPHSDDTRDVMYPQNTATRLTARDFRTLEALYGLPNGAEIRR
jgi:predicted Zn-dependent protease